MHRKLIDLIARMVPRRFRSAWKQEWEAELYHRELRKGSNGLFRRSLGAFWDALALQPRRLEEEIYQDVRHGIRLFAKSRALTITAVLSLALGIGANTALFSMIDAVLLKKLPVKNPDELVLFQWSGAGSGALNITTDRSTPQQNEGDTFSYVTFERFREHNRTLADIFGFAHLYSANLIADGRADATTGEIVSGNFFSSLGTTSSLGRTITSDDDKPSAEPVAVLSHRYWQLRFNGDRSVLGKEIQLNGAPFTVVGVTSPEFTGTVQVDESPDVYIPMAFEPAVMPRFAARSKVNYWWIWVMGRKKPGVTFDQIRGNLEGVLNDTALQSVKATFNQAWTNRPGDPNAPKPPSLRLEAISGSRGLVDRRQNYAEPLLIIMTLVAVALLISCTNVANLILARASARRSEVGVRLALGATRFRLIRQLLTESVLLASCGGILGVILAYLGKDLMLRWGPWASNPSAIISLHLDVRVLAFTAAISVITGILFGVVPAIGATRRDLNAMMQSQTRVAGSRSYLGKALLVGQVALSLVLVIGAGLFVRTLNNFHDVVSGIDPARLLQFSVDPRLNNLDSSRAVVLLEDIVQRLETIPGVKSVTLVGSTYVMDTGTYVPVRANFFDTMGIPMVSGRTFNSSDIQLQSTAVRGGAPQPRLAVVNEAFVRKHSPDANPLGKNLRGSEIIGVVRDAKYTQLREDVAPIIYFPYQNDVGRATFRVRTAGDPRQLFPAVRDAVFQIDSHLPITNVRTLQDQIDQSLAKERMFAGFSTFLGVLALVLTCVGFYGVMSYSVARRTNEIGIRMALGAQRLSVLRLVISEGLVLVIIGAVLGSACAVAAGRFIASILFGLSPTDTMTIALAVALMITVAGIAAFVPARRASRVDPVVALRYE